MRPQVISFISKDLINAPLWNVITLKKTFLQSLLLEEALLKRAILITFQHGGKKLIFFIGYVYFLSTSLNSKFELKTKNNVLLLRFNIRSWQKNDEKLQSIWRYWGCNLISQHCQKPNFKTKNSLAISIKTNVCLFFKPFLCWRCRHLHQKCNCVFYKKAK